VPRERRATELRKVELTQAALRIIATRGITALGTRSLAAEVGLSSGAIFRHYPSLDALLEAVVAHVEGVLDATFPPPQGLPLERLERFIDARSLAVGNEQGILRLLLSEQFLLALPQPASERLSACVEKTRVFVARCLREAQQAGQARADIPVDALAPIVMGTIQMLALAKGGTRARAANSMPIRTALVALLQPVTFTAVTPARRKKPSA